MSRLWHGPPRRYDGAHSAYRARPLAFRMQRVRGALVALGIQGNRLRLARMRRVLLFAALASCAPARTVYVPSRSHQCWRECKAISLTCLNTPVPYGQLTSREEYCEEERLNCLLTCPGARETTGKTQKARPGEPGEQ